MHAKMTEILVYIIIYKLNYNVIPWFLPTDRVPLIAKVVIFNKTTFFREKKKHCMPKIRTIIIKKKKKNK